jgi:hypothetical protein
MVACALDASACGLVGEADRRKPWGLKQWKKQLNAQAVAGLAIEACWLARPMILMTGISSTALIARKTQSKTLTSSGPEPPTGKGLELRAGVRYFRAMKGQYGTSRQDRGFAFY